jgi:hypothetical protein
MTIFKQKDELNYEMVLSELEKWKIDTRLYVAHKYNLSIETDDAKAIDIILGNIKEDFSHRMSSDDPAFWMLKDDFHSTPTAYNPNCYICRDPEFAAMGMPLCYPCYKCGAHVPADDCVCDNGHDQTDSENDNL